MLDPTLVKDIPTRPIAILNRDDVSYNVLLPYCRVPILDYGIDQAAAVRAVDIRLRAHSTSFRVIFPDSELQIETQLVGNFNVSNCWPPSRQHIARELSPPLLLVAWPK